MKKAFSLRSFLLFVSLSHIFITGSCFCQSCPGMEKITDLRDGQIYSTVQIGSQCWLQRNMNFETDNSWCYNDEKQNCVIYGRLYDWQTAISVCPPGWQLPSDDEWTILINFLGGDSLAGGKLKEAGTLHWFLSGNYNNEIGFTALPGGYRLSNRIYSNLGTYVYFWTSTGKSKTHSWVRHISYNNDEAYRYHSNKATGFYVRCLKDTPAK